MALTARRHRGRSSWWSLALGPFQCRRMPRRRRPEAASAPMTNGWLGAWRLPCAGFDEGGDAGAVLLRERPASRRAMAAEPLGIGDDYCIDTCRAECGLGIVHAAANVVGV